MNLRKRMEHEINLAQKRLEEAPESTPLNIKKLWEQELVDLEIELNNLVDDEEDNNDL
ncbi:MULTISPECIES: hypothetical protein [unclassified Bacteroides]|jgi:hypothetical protein|uniref:hypothetical protein n=1 Tax=unclassified Bacteroides TaxID=2646097 RepID=UPI0015B6A3B3|nr:MULTISPECIES: hypothetical protein [unclassified Bacteroides]